MAAALTASFLVSLFRIFWFAFVLKMWWGWFMVPHFKVGTLPYAVAVGFILLILIAQFKSVKADDESPDPEEMLNQVPFALLHALMYGGLVLLIGFFASWCV